MPIENAIWKIGKQPIRLQESSLSSESLLEEMICADSGLLSTDWMLIGRQVPTAYGKYIDLLAIDITGSLIVIELKKNKTPREIVAQSIDYASWVKDISHEKIAEIFSAFSGGKESLNAAFQKKFSQVLDEETLNQSHQIVIVAAELDSSTERIVNYLSDFNVAINVLFFRIFKDGANTYISRTWLIDPAETREIATTAISNREPWNNEFYVSFGHHLESHYNRRWEDAYRYGFISGGGGRWYSQTLFQLQKGDRVWVNIPKKGYVGVGRVEAPAVKASEFMIKGKSFLELKSKLSKIPVENDANDDLAEYMVRINWIKKEPLEKAIWEVGFFGNQNTVAKPTAEKWVYTVDRLKKLWNIK